MRLVTLRSTKPNRNITSVEVTGLCRLGQGHIHVMSNAVNDGTRTDLSDQSAGELVKRATEQISALVRDEMRLARAELAEKGKHAGLGAGMFGLGGALALYGLGVLIAAAILGLAEALPAWAAALIVGVVLLAVAGVLALTGRKQFKRATPAMPEETVRSVRQDIGAVSTAVEERNRR